MEDLTDLLNGVAQFNEVESQPVKPLLERLAREGQTPDALFITCADSRIDPVFITQSMPGDLFILRNIGNLVPLVASGDASVLATVEYSLGALGVRSIVVCGHSDCGAMKAVVSRKDLTTMPHAKEWLTHADASVREYENGHAQVRFADDLPEHDKLSQVNVVTQFENLFSYPIIRQGIENETLRLVGMWFDIANAQVNLYNAEEKMFVPASHAEIEKRERDPSVTLQAAAVAAAS